MRILAILIFSFLAISSFGSTTKIDIRGVILDMKNTPIPYATIFLLNSDSTFINGCTTDDNGAFFLPDSLKEGMSLKVSAIGYNTLVAKISTIYFPTTLKLENKSYQLGEVTIKRNRPMQHLSKGGIVTTVKGSVLSIAGNAVDVIGQLPGVRIEDEQISVLGKGYPIIYINGRKLNDLSELNRLPSNEIESIEVLNNPGARYSAETKSVILIKTIRKNGEGLSGNIQSLSRLAHSFSQSGNMALNYRHNNIDVFGSLALDYSKRYQKQDNSTHIDFNNEVYDLKSALTIFPLNTSYIANLGFNWQVNKDNTLGLKYEFHGIPNGSSNWNQQEKVFLNGEWQDEITYYTHWKRKTMPQNMLNVYYLGNINHWSFSLNNDFYYSKNTVNQDMKEDSNFDNGENTINSLNHIRNKMIATKGVVGYTLQKSKTELGYEYTYTDRIDNFLNYGILLPNSDNQIKEGNFAVFLSTNITFGKYEVSGGVRYEHTVSDYYQNKQIVKEQSRKYSNFFPTIDFSFPIKQANFSLSYTAKTRRPLYSQLSSNIQYDDRFTYEQGNPMLQSEINHDITLAGIYKWLYFSASYQYVRNAIVGIVESYSENEPINLMTFVNYKHISKYSSVLSVSPKISKWSPQLILNFMGQDFKINAMGKSQLMNNPLLFFNLYNNIKMCKGMTLNGDIIGHTSGNMDVVSLKPSWQINIGITKTTKRWFFQLNATDLFKTARNSMITYGSQMVLDKWNYSDSQAVRFTVRYSFNSTNNRYKGSNAGQKEINRL